MKKLTLLIGLITLTSCSKEEVCNCVENTYELYYDEYRMQQKRIIDSEPVECQEEYEYEYGGLFAIGVKCY